MTLLTTAQIAERTHSKPATVRAWIRRGDLTASFVGRQWLATEDAVEELIARTSNRERRSARRRRNRGSAPHEPPQQPPNEQCPTLACRQDGH